MTVNEITSWLEVLCPPQLQEDYDNAGLISGNPGMEVTGILLSLDLTREVVAEALARRCNLVISHHPFIFSPLKKLKFGTPEADILAVALKNDLALYAIHTNLDNSRDGLNGLLMNRIGISKYDVLRPSGLNLVKLATFCPADHAEKVRQAIFDAGAGQIGNYDCCSFNVRGEGTFRASDGANPFVGKMHELHYEPEVRVEVILPGYLAPQVIRAMKESHPYEEVAYDLYPLSNMNTMAGSGLIGDLQEPMPAREFLALVKKELQVAVIRHTQMGSAMVKKVAICSGSGSFLIGDAIAAGSDAFLTGDLKYHDFFIPDGRLLLADIGHYESEQWVKEWVFAALNQKFTNFAILKSEINTNPVNYF